MIKEKLGMFMSRYKKRLLFFALFVLTAFLNFIARKKMSFSYAAILPYNHLYTNDNQLRITKLEEKENGSIGLTFAGEGIKEENAFEVYCEHILLAKAEGNELVFKPLDGAKRYYIKINLLRDSVSLDIGRTPDSVYSASGNSSKLNFEVTYADIPVESGHLYSINDWALRFDQWNSPAENAEAKSYLEDSMKISAADGGAERVLKIAAFVLQRTQGMGGIPSDSMASLSPVNQLKCVQAGKSGLWCGNYTAIFSFFADRAGIPVRWVGLGEHRTSSISPGTHVFSEVFLKEYNQWVYVDLTAKTVFVKKGDRLLNAIDVHRLMRYSIEDSSLSAVYFNGDSIVHTPFKQVSSLASYYFNNNNTFTFYYADYLERQNPQSIFDRVKRFFYIKPYYALYGDAIHVSNSQFVFRLGTMYLMVLFLGIAFLLFIWGFLQRLKKR